MAITGNEPEEVLDQKIDKAITEGFVGYKYTSRMIEDNEEQICPICHNAADDVQSGCDQILRLNVYKLGKEYGGPEEGGWYATTYEPLASFVLDNKEMAQVVWKTVESFYKNRFDTYNPRNGYGYKVSYKIECRMGRYHVSPTHYE